MFMLALGSNGPVSIFLRLPGMMRLPRMGLSLLHEHSEKVTLWRSCPVWLGPCPFHSRSHSVLLLEVLCRVYRDWYIDYCDLRASCLSSSLTYWIIVNGNICGVLSRSAKFPCTLNLRTITRHFALRLWSWWSWEQNCWVGLFIRVRIIYRAKKCQESRPLHAFRFTHAIIAHCQNGAISVLPFISKCTSI